MCKNLIVIALAVLFLAAVPNAQANLIFNGGMEIDDNLDGVPDGWSHLGAAPSDNTVMVQSTNVPPGGGTYSLHLSSGGAAGPLYVAGGV